MKKSAKIALAAAGCLVTLPVFLVAPGRATKEMKTPFMHRNLAHRGLHTADKSIPENSLPAFERAASAGYGIELDVQLSRDGEVVVFHDDTLDRVCGVHSRVDEKTLSELQQLHLCGSDCTVPLFTDVLQVIRGRGPLLVELKTGRHNKELCQKTYDILKQYQGAVCIESFDPTIVMWFRFHAPELMRGQLSMRPAEYTEESYRILKYPLGNVLFNVLARPHFIAYKTGGQPLLVHLSQALGAMRFVWTSHDASNEKHKDAVIFEFYEPELKYGK